MSSWFDTINDKLKDTFSNYSDKLIQSQLDKLTTVKVAAPPKSNLTADQVAKGEKGAIAGLEQASSMMGKYMIPIIVLVSAIVLGLVLRRK